MVKDENYVVVQGWMINKLKLAGNDLLIYSIIYGFTQTEGNRFTGSLKYLMEWTNSSKSTVIRSLKNLIEKNYIYKYVINKNGIQLCEYDIGGVKMTPGWCQNDTGGGVKMTPNNIIYNNKNNIDILTSENACNPPNSKKEKQLTALQEFSNEVVKKFEQLEDFQIGIWFKRNCRCLSDILKFCGGKKEDIPLAIECINVCCDIMAKKGFEGAGYEAVCRNLPYYYTEAKKRLKIN